jgi:hypothetical protein
MKTATKPSKASIKAEIEKRAAKLNMRVLKIGQTTCVLLADEQLQSKGKEISEPFTAHLYQINLADSVWLPGRCLASLQRKDVPAEQFEAIAANLVYMPVWQ